LKRRFYVTDDVTVVCKHANFIGDEKVLIRICMNWTSMLDTLSLILIVYCLYRQMETWL